MVTLATTATRVPARIQARGSHRHGLSPPRREVPVTWSPRDRVRGRHSDERPAPSPPVAAAGANGETSPIPSLTPQGGESEGR